MARSDRFISSRAKADSTADSRTFFATGLVRKSTAPVFIARTLIGISPWPERNTIGTVSPDLANASCRSSPLRPGIRTSSITQPGQSDCRFNRKSPADACTRTSWPAARNKRATAVLTESSSSTTCTIGEEEVIFSFARAALVDLRSRTSLGKILVRLARLGRQRDRHRRAAVRIVGSPDFAAVALDDGATD